MAILDEFIQLPIERNSIFIVTSSIDHTDIEMEVQRG
jgi:hypothetical protein